MKIAFLQEKNQEAIDSVILCALKTPSTANVAFLFSENLMDIKRKIFLYDFGITI